MLHSTLASSSDEMHLVARGVILLTTASGLSQQITAALVGGVTDESGVGSAEHLDSKCVALLIGTLTLDVPVSLIQFSVYDSDETDSR